MYRRLSRTPVNPTRLAGSVVRVSRAVGVGEAERLLRRAGYRSTAIVDHTVLGVRRRWAPYGDVVFHFGLIVLIAGVLVTAAPQLTSTERGTVVEAGRATGSPAPRLAPRGVGGPGRGYSLRSLRATASGDVDTVLEATLERPGGSVTLSAGEPHLLSIDRMLTIEGWGYAPIVSVTPSGSTLPAVTTVGRVGLQHEIDESEADLVRAAGKVYRVSVTLDPKRLPADRRRAVFDSSQVPPLVMTVAALRRDGTFQVLRSAVPVTPGTVVRADSARIRLDAVPAFATLRVASSPGIPLVAAGLFAALAGLAMRLLFPRQEAVVRTTPEGFAVLVRSDYYRNADGEAERVARRLARS